SGFVGRPLVRALITNGYAVRALARSATSARVLQAAGAEVVMGDLSDPTALRRGCEDAVTVINCAGHLKMWDTEEAFRKTNVEGTRNLLGAAKSVGVKRFVQIGASASVMGNPKPMVDIRGGYVSAFLSGLVSLYQNESRGGSLGTQGESLQLLHFSHSSAADLG